MSFSEKITLLQNMTTMALKMKMKIQQDQQGLSPLRLTVRGSQLHLTPLLQLTMDHRLSRSMRHFTLPVPLSSTQEILSCQSNQASDTNVSSQETSAQVHSSARSDDRGRQGFCAGQTKRARKISSAGRRSSVVSVISASSSSSRRHMFQESNVNSTLTDIA